jgi:hypothetical protein
LRLWNVWHVAIEFGRAVYFPQLAKQVTKI